ncbi:MAG: hypothetical protein ACYC21_12290 [Eubacteriales bacterium]
MDVSDVNPDSLMDELTALAKGRKSEEVRLMLNINKLVIDYLDKKK